MTGLVTTRREGVTTMDDHDDSGGLAPGDERVLEFWLRFAALLPESQRRVLALIERIKASELN